MAVGRPEYVYKREQEVGGIIARAKERAPFNLPSLRKSPRQRPPWIHGLYDEAKVTFEQRG